MHVKPRMTLQPTLDLGMLVCGVVVVNQMQIEIGRCLRIDRFKTTDPLLVTMAGHALGNDSHLGKFQEREQRCGAMTLVVVVLV